MSFFSKIRASVRGFFDEVTHVNDDFYDELEERLILSDVGAELSASCVERLRERVKTDGLRGSDEIKAALKEILLGIFDNTDAGETFGHPQTASGSVQTAVGGAIADSQGSSLQIILVIGVNGVGKTTTIGKLAAKYRAEKKRVVLAAADTFRAAAADQLAVWAERSGAELIRGKEGGDPGAVLFDAVAAAKARYADVLICDTAGRLQNKANLMKELEKLNRIIEREAPPGAIRENLLIIDAATGQNGLIQAKSFTGAAELTGIVLTKMDGTAKGGIVFAVASEMNLPVKWVGLGEQIDELMPFDKAAFVDAIIN